jgi:hypothetical protein
MLRHAKAENTSIDATRVTHASWSANCPGVTNATSNTRAGTNTERANRSRQKCISRCVAKPATTQAVTKLTSKATDATMSLEPTVQEA